MCARVLSGYVRYMRVSASTYIVQWVSKSVPMSINLAWLYHLVMNFREQSLASKHQWMMEAKKNDKQILRQYLWNDFAVLCVCGEKARDDGIREIPYWFVFHLISFCLVLVLVFGASFTNWSYTNNKLYVVCCAMCLYYTTHNIFIVMTSVLLLLSARSRSLSLFIAFIAFRSSASIAPNTKKNQQQPQQRQ